MTEWSPIHTRLVHVLQAPLYTGLSAKHKITHTLCKELAPHSSTAMLCSFLLLGNHTSRAASLQEFILVLYMAKWHATPLDHVVNTWYHRRWLLNACAYKNGQQWNMHLPKNICLIERACATMLRPIHARVYPCASLQLIVFWLRVTQWD